MNSNQVRKYNFDKSKKSVQLLAWTPGKWCHKPQHTMLLLKDSDLDVFFFIPALCFSTFYFSLLLSYVLSGNHGHYEKGWSNIEKKRLPRRIQDYILVEIPLHKKEDRHCKMLDHRTFCEERSSPILHVQDDSLASITQYQILKEED